jgi:hypothetical protein
VKAHEITSSLGGRWLSVKLAGTLKNLSRYAIECLRQNGNCKAILEVVVCDLVICLTWI